MTRSRGQALVETVISLPLFILALFAMIWGIRAGVMAERVQSGVRNAGIVLSHADPYGTPASSLPTTARTMPHSRSLRCPARRRRRNR